MHWHRPDLENYLETCVQISQNWPDSGFAGAEIRYNPSECGWPVSDCWLHRRFYSQITVMSPHHPPAPKSVEKLLNHCKRSQSATLLSFHRLVFPPSVIGLFQSPRLGCGTACQTQWHQRRLSTRSSSGWKLNSSFAATTCRPLMHANILYRLKQSFLSYCCTTHDVFFLLSVLVVFGLNATIISFV